MRAKTIAGLLLVFNQRGSLALAEKKERSKMGAGLLNAAGGTLQPNENILECVVRENKEEFGIDARIQDLHHLGSLECYVRDSTHPSGFVLHQRVHVYWTDEYSGVPRETDSMRQPEWFRPERLPLDRMHEGDRFWFPQAALRKKFRIQIWYERPGEGYIEHVEGEY